MNERTGKILKYAASLAAALLLLWFSFRGVEWKDFISLLKECRWGWVLLSMLAGYCAIIVRSLRWKMLLSPLDRKLSFLRCYDAVNIARVSDFVLPHMGELVRCAVVSSRPKAGHTEAVASVDGDSSDDGRISYDKALGTVVLERSWDILSLVLLVIIFLLTAGRRFAGFFSQNILEPISERLSFSIWWIFFLVIVLLAGLAVFFYKTRSRNAVSRKIFGFLRGIWQGVGTCLKMEHKGLFILYTLILWGLFLLTSLFVIYALPTSYGLGVTDAFFLMLVGSLAGIVPVPGGFGAFHYVIALTLSTLYGIPWQTGIIFATLSHESQAIMTATAGLASYFHRTLRKKA